MNEELFQLFATLIYNHAGIRLNEQKKTLLVSRLQKRIRSLGCAGYHDYYKRVKVDEDERVMMLNCISTNTTKFFRENHHFEFLRDTLIPGLIESRDTQKELRIWSAGCSTGEEPYSIAISISEAFRDMFQNWDPIDPYCGWSVKILATDISTNVLNRAQEGLYDRGQLPEGLSQDFLRHYFLKGNNSFAGMVTVKNFLKDVIRFRRLNFKDMSYPFSCKFDLIFCRNVMIYFDDTMKNHVLDKFCQHLAVDGHIFLGHSETILNNSLFKSVGITVYRRL